MSKITCHPLRCAEQGLKQTLTWWDQFFFHAKFQNIGLCRLILGSVIFYLTVMKSFNLDFFTVDAIVPKDQSMTLFHELVQPLFSWNFWPDEYVLWAHGAVCVLSFLFAIGFLGRLGTFVLFSLYMGFIHRNYAVLFGADVLSALFLFYFILARPNQTFSIYEFFGKKPLIILPPEWDQAISSAGFRLLQIQVALIYTYTGFEKLRGNSWWNGTALWTVMSNPQMVIWDLAWLKSYPLLIGVMTYSAMIFEIFFGWAMCNSKTRTPWLVVGVVFHLMIGISMDLMPFSLVMMATYVLYLKERVSWKDWLKI